MTKSTIYTRKGDDGTTVLIDGNRFPKNHPLIVAYGQLDELGCAIGLVLSHEDLPKVIRKILETILSTLPKVTLDLYPTNSAKIEPEHVRALEKWIDGYDQTLPKITHFIQPTGTRVSVECHWARTICRRAERSLVNCYQQSPFNPIVLAYINRLSDLLFVLARVLNQTT